MNKYLLFIFVAACHSAPKSAPPASAARSKVALVVMDGFGLGAAGSGNAIAEAMRRQPGGFFTRVLAERAEPMLELGASGRCVGLSAGMVGNSEAGHSNMCAADVLEQRRTYIDDLVAQGRLGETPALKDALSTMRAAGKPLHVLAYLSAYSSTGYYGHVIDVLRVAKAAGQANVQLHVVCDGSGERACRDMLGEIDAEARALGVGTVATVMGRDLCFGKGDPGERQRRCVEAMRRPRTGQEPAWRDVVSEDIAQDASLTPTPLVGSRGIDDDATLVVLFYRRDDPQALVRTLRGREKEGDPVAQGGPLVLTFALLDDVSRYADDPKLREVFDIPKREGFLNEQLTAAGLTQARLAEHKKMAHVTYFCDGSETPASDRYHRFHPRSMSSDEARREPCIRTREVSRAAQREVELGVDFLMMNLPNADLLGHTADFEAAVRAVQCLETELAAFVQYARERGYTVFITGDHGNAEEMLRDGVWHGNHSQNPVPFIALAPHGAPPVRLIEQGTAPLCLYRVSWTVLDALGLPSSNERSLLRVP